MASVRIENVSKVYSGEVDAVRDISFEVADGEFVVLVGPSGCGKSTTLRMIAGLESITSGEVRIADRVVNDIDPGQRDLAMVFQNYALYPHMTARGNMDFGLRMRRVAKPERRKRIANAAEMLGIQNLLDRRPAELSGGQRQRVALGRAIVREPAAFLFDEPLSNLDAKLRAEMRTEIASLHQRLQSTMIYVTHDQTEAMTLSDRLILMNEGSIQQHAQPMDVYNRPANLFVATFIGTPAMNRFDGEVHAGTFHAEQINSWPADTAPDGAAVLGVRSEDLYLATEHTPVFAEARTIRLERLGHETLLHAEVGKTRCVVRLPSEQTSNLGETIRLTIRPGRTHLFSAQPSGERLN